MEMQESMYTISSLYHVSATSRDANHSDFFNNHSITLKMLAGVVAHIHGTG